MNGSIVRICLLLVKGSVLKRVQRNTNNFSEWLVWLERPNEFSLIGVRVVLTSFFDFILSEARVLITKVNLFNVTFYFFYILRDMFYVKEQIQTVTSNLWQIISVDSSPIVFCTALIVRPTLYWKFFPGIFGQIVI